MLAALKPLGVWGIGALAVIDSAAIPVPIDALLIDYVANDHRRFLLYCFMAALGSAIGSLLPYYLGRAGGELFLLKRINRQRYEQLRDRFEKQEFLGIMIPAMMPPPMPSNPTRIPTISPKTTIRKVCTTQPFCFDGCYVSSR